MAAHPHNAGAFPFEGFEQFEVSLPDVEKFVKYLAQADPEAPLPGRCDRTEVGFCTDLVPCGSVYVLRCSMRACARYGTNKSKTAVRMSCKLYESDVSLSTQFITLSALDDAYNLLQHLSSFGVSRLGPRTQTSGEAWL